MNELSPTTLGQDQAIHVQPFFDERTYTLTFIVHHKDTKDAVVIDPVLDYSPANSLIWTESTDRVVQFIKEHSLNLHFILETHAHADHLSGARRIQQEFPDAKIAIGTHIQQVQSMFRSTFDLPESFPVDGSQFDLLLKDHTTYNAGAISFDVLPTPGHTPACVSFLIEDAVFTGDAIFMPDIGTGRCDFPGGSARDLYNSITKELYTLPDTHRILPGHDYPPSTRTVSYSATVGEHKENNKALNASHTFEDFVAWREARDATLSPPKLLFQSIQINIDAGNLPQPNSDGKRTLRIPLNIFRPEPNPEKLELSDATCS